MKKAGALLFTLALHISLITVAQKDSTCRLRVSLLTCSPGEELYSSFGHTAIRVIDSNRNMDMVFNYGTFDDSDPQFYLKFTKGLMRYALSAYPFPDFLQEYQEQQRSVIEQELNLPCNAKQQLLQALIINNQPENRFYNYYFHTDNCTTRARDMITQKTGLPVVFKNILPDKIPSYRQLIHSYLDAGGQYWSKFGIDILLGAHLDKKVSNQEAMFLPDYLLKGFDSASAGPTPLVSSRQTILSAPPLSPDARTWLTPVFFFTTFFLLITALSFSGSNGITKALRIFDCFFFLLLGLLGVLLATLWTIRIDTVCRNNWNLLWALPSHLPLAFLVWSRKNWVKKYFQTVMIITILLALCWFFLPQQLNPAIAPILGMILVRAYFRSK